MDNRVEVREFLASRRARITPEQAGLPAFGGNRRVKGLRREEVALLAGVSIDYYIRMERGDLGGACACESCRRPLSWPKTEPNLGVETVPTATSKCISAGQARRRIRDSNS